MARVEDTPDLEFTECEVCAAKPGFPPLCPSCLHNRRVVSLLHKALKSANARLATIQKVLDL